MRYLLITLLSIVASNASADISAATKASLQNKLVNTGFNCENVGRRSMFEGGQDNDTSEVFDKIGTRCTSGSLPSNTKEGIELAMKLTGTGYQLFGNPDPRNTKQIHMTMFCDKEGVLAGTYRGSFTAGGTPIGFGLGSFVRVEDKAKCTLRVSMALGMMYIDGDNITIRVAPAKAISEKGVPYTFRKEANGRWTPVRVED